MAREKSHLNWIVEASKRPEMIAFPDNTPRFGFVEAYDHFLHVSRTNPNMLTIATLSRAIASLRLQGNIMGCKRLGRADCIAMRSLPGV